MTPDFSVFVIVGPSGAGKGSIARALVGRVPGLWLSRSWTTRPCRPGEADGDYVFVSPEEFDRASSEGLFLEEAEVFGHRYGTPLPSVPEGRDLLLEIDVQGARQVRRFRPDAVVVLVTPPSRQVQQERLHQRGDDETVIVRRLEAAGDEEAQARALADHEVVNDSLERAVEQVTGIVENHRSRRSQPSPEEV